MPFNILLGISNEWEMALYKLLEGIRVLELSFLAPDALGGHLADLGAEVIKVEEPPHGSRIRWPGAPHWRLLHWRWNRGKKSVFLSLKTKAGREAFLKLAENADVVIDGMRAGAVKRLGVDYQAVRNVNPRAVYCALTGFGQTGDYRHLPSHGWGFDAIAGLAKPAMAEDGAPRIPEEGALVGIQAGPLFAGMAVLAALLRARATGVGQFIDVAQADCAVAWRATELDSLANSVPRPKKSERLRYQIYETADGEQVLFMAMEDKFWSNFCEAVDRRDLYHMDEADPAQMPGMRDELTRIFRSRTRAEWVQLFIEKDVAGAPLYRGLDVLDDRHFAVRDIAFDQMQRDGGTLHLVGTPIRLPGEPFAPLPAPEAGADTSDILRRLGGYGDAEIATLASGADDKQ